MCGSMTVSGSSNMITFTSDRTSPRPSEIFCFSSAVSLEARRESLSCKSSIPATSRTRASTASGGIARLRNGKARFPWTVIVS